MIVTLTTDFGSRDPYVGAMKGALLSTAANLTLVDLSHAVPPHDVLAGAFLLRHAAFQFPPGTVHLAVVDPGVGGRRRPLVVDAAGYRWVGPDNGLLSFALERAEARAFEITHPDLAPESPSATFHGRDIFAPTAAHLARGFRVAQVGPPVLDPVVLPPVRCRRDGARLIGAVVHVDHFGNLITSIDSSELAGLDAGSRVCLADVVIDGLVSTYASVADGELAALVGSGGLLEIAVHGGSAAERLGLSRGDPVTVEPSS